MQIYPYKISDFVLLESYNLYGGFYWHLNNYLICSYFVINIIKSQLLIFILHYFK